MRESSFIAQNAQKWAEFETQLKAERHEPEKLNELYVQITDDLSYARTFYPNRSVRMYLNKLAQRVFHNIYRGKRFPAERLRMFWSDELPHIIWDTRKTLLLSFALFVLSFGIGVLSSRINPDFARLVLGDQYIEMTLENIRKGDPMAVYKDSGPLGMSIGIAANNLFVALRTAVFGVLASIGTVFIMLYNGIMVGAFQYFFVEQGVFWDSFLTIWIHGTLEISAIIISGAAGMVAGSGLLFPGTYTRIQAFQISMRKGLKIFIGIVPIMVLAAFFEGFLTRFTETPAFIRAAFIAISLFFVLWYFVWLPRHKALYSGFKSNIQAFEVIPDREKKLSAAKIKSSGELVAETFWLFRKHLKKVLTVVLGAPVLLLLWTFALGSENIADTYFFDDSMSGTFTGVQRFFSNNSAPGLAYGQWLLLAVCAAMAFQILAAETAERTILDKSWLARLPILLPVAGFVGFMQLEAGFMAWLVAIIGLPFLSAWCAATYFGDANPLQALGQTFRSFRWSPAFGLGFMVVNLALLFYAFLDTGIWNMTLQLFSWLIPSGAANMALFMAVCTVWIAGAITYFILLFLIVSGALAYFSNIEIVNATHLHAQIRQVGNSPKIRGLAKE